MKNLKSFFSGFRQVEFFPVFIGATLLGFAAWQNMYPLVYPDTGTYVLSGIESRIPIDRPLLYGLFLRHTSMRETMWLSLLAQVLLVSSVLYAFIKSYFRNRSYKTIYYFILVPLIGCTAISIKSCTLIPDAFTPLSILCFFILVRANQPSVLRMWFMTVMIFCISVHQSHLMILLVAFLLFAIAESLQHGLNNTLSKTRNLKFMIPVLLLSFLLTPIINLSYSGKFYWSQSGSIFIMGRLADNGMLQSYLRKNCESHSYEMCNYVEQIPSDFLWNENSPLHKMGGWENPSPEYDLIIRDLITTPKYFFQLCYKSLSASITQFFTFNISLRAENEAMSYDSPPHYALRTVYNHEMNQYLNSNQNVKRLNYDAIDARQLWFIIIIFSLFALIKISKLGSYTTHFRRLLSLIFFYTLSNAIICGVLSIPNPRYQTRVFWLIPLVILMLMISLWINHRKEILAYFKG